MKRSIFNLDNSKEFLDKESEEILNSMEISKKEESKSAEIEIKIEQEQVKSKSKPAVKYNVQIKVTKDREIRMINYIVESESKTQAGKIGRDKLVENGYDDKNVILCRVTKAKPSDTDQDVLFDIMKISYEVSFNIKIGLERFRKTFVIKAKDEKEATDTMLTRCKKEFKGYKSITKVEVTEAKEGAMESSKLIESAIVTAKATEKDEKKNKMKYVDAIRIVLKDIIEDYVKDLPEETKNKKIVAIQLSSNDKSAKEFIESSKLGEKLYFESDSTQKAKEFVEGEDFYKSTNRELRRKIKWKYSQISFISAFKEYMQKTIEEDVFPKLPEPNKETEGINEEFKEEIRKIFVPKLTELTDKFIDSIKLEDSNDDDKEIDLSKIEKVEAVDLAEKDPDIEFIEEKGRVVKIKKKTALPLNIASLKEYRCKVIMKNGDESDIISVEAESKESVSDILVRAIANGHLKGCNANDIDLLKIMRISNKGDKISTWDVVVRSHNLLA